MIDTRKKCYQNGICRSCIKKHIKKYGSLSELVCSGITVEEEVKFAIQNGLDEHTARWLYDPCYFFTKVYGSPPRHYQKHALLCTSKNLTARQCRQSGKSLTFIYRVMHYVLTNENVSVLIIAPQEVQIKKLWDEYILRDCIYKDPDLKKSIVSKSMSPNYIINFDNGSKITLQIAGPACRGATANWIYIDEAAMIANENLADIMAVIMSKGDEACILLTSTPKGRGNLFYRSCKEDASFSEIHVKITDVKELEGQIPRFKKLLTETAYIQECEGEFPDLAGGPFNLRGIDLAKADYEYGIHNREEGWIYFGGVDWNGAAIGTYISILGFHPVLRRVKVVDSKVISSAVWNSTEAKNAIIELNRVWNCQHWMVDSGYGHSIIEEIKRYSYLITGKLGAQHPDSQLKYIVEPVEFGSFTNIEDPFTREIKKKMMKPFIVSHVSKLFEPIRDFGEEYIPFMFSRDHKELVDSLENYQLLTTTSRGIEQYGFDKKSGIEDHLIDSVFLAVYGIVKYYNDLFKKMIYSSAVFSKEVLAPQLEEEKLINRYGSIILLTDNSPEPIYLDNAKIKEPIREDSRYISRTLSKGNLNRNPYTSVARRSSPIIKRAI